MQLLEGKVVLVTGASKGIGKSIAEACCNHGASVAFSFIDNAEKAKAIEDALSANGNKVKGYRSDASDFDQSHTLIDEVMKEFGRIDVLINNAGITRDNLLLRMSEDDFNRVIKTNLNSAFNLTKAVTKPMMKQRGGSIINISSVVGVKGNAGQANYAASKAGMIGLTKSVALELGSRSVRCNAIAPGFIETEMTEVLDEKVVQGWRDAIPLKRGGSSMDVANACVFLGSDMSAYVTGQVLNVCGGMLT